MRSATLKWIILLSTILVGLLVCVQLYWLNKIYNFEQKEFATSVVKSIQGVYEDLELSDSSGTELQKLITQPDVNTFLFKIDNIPEKDTIVKSVLNNLEDFGVFTDCKLALYDARTQNYAYQVYLPSAASKHPGNSGIDLPLFKNPYAYIHLYFPHRGHYILSSMLWWIASSILLLVILIALGLSIFHLYRQKFLNEVQNDFIRNVTHEFQTPLTTLIVGLDAIAKPSIIEYPERLEKYTRLMQGQTAYLKQHIENLMKVLKAEANGLVLEKEEIVPNELIKNAINQLHVTIEEKHAAVELILEPTNGTVLADKSSFYVAMLNLVTNAIKYSNKPMIIVETKVTNGVYFISVKDNGIGIEEQYQKKLFRKFYRVPTGDVHDVKGLGLGLYFVKKVVDENKGTIHVKSITGIGSEFVIELPTH
ncbi:MAG: integral rane sensor signal transduction histidine kinase [Ferruginibacter sp.]|nr:integral rane sensor signal transduction histidine kinase [Ferruginibacter sp.]